MRLEKEADLIIAMSHLGLEGDRELAADTDGLDLILGAHTHTLMETPEEIDRTLIVQAGAFGQHVGRLDLTLNSEKDEILDYHWILVSIPVQNLPPDPETKKVVDHWEGKVAVEMNVVIGQSEKFLQRDKELRAMVARIWMEAYQTDFGWQNPGANMQDLSAGPIEVRDFYEILPWGNTLVILDLTPAQIRDILEAEEFQIGEKKTIYTLITNSFAARELVERFELTEDSVHRIPVQARDFVIAYVRKYGRLPGID